MRLPSKEEGDAKEGAGQEGGQESIQVLSLWGFGNISILLRALQSRTDLVLWVQQPFDSVFLSKYLITHLVKARNHWLMTEFILGLSFFQARFVVVERAGGAWGLVRVSSPVDKVINEPENACNPPKVTFWMKHWLSIGTSHPSKGEFNSLTIFTFYS